MTSKRPLVSLLLLIASVVLLSGIGARPAQALSCSATVSPPAFGSPDILSGAAIYAIGSLSVTCAGSGAERNMTVLACPNMSLGSGNLAARGPQRYLASASSSQLYFNIYQDNYTTLWGGTADMGGTAPAVFVTLDGSGNGTSSDIPVYARINAAQTSAPVGLYQTIITVDVRSSTNTNFGCDTVNTNSSQSSFNVSANYIANCIMATSSLNFGMIGSLTSAVDAEAPLSLTCSNGSSYAVALDGGQAAVSDPTQRRMTKAGNVLYYGLYRDSGRQQPWGSDSGTTRTGTGTGLTQSLSVYGRIPAQAMAPPGTYQDTIVATVSY